MSHIFGKLWHSAIIWPIGKSYQCILQGVRFLQAKQTWLSPTSENESYVHSYIATMRTINLISHTLVHLATFFERKDEDQLKHQQQRQHQNKHLGYTYAYKHLKYPKPRIAFRIWLALSTIQNRKHRLRWANQKQCHSREDADWQVRPM